MNLIDTPFELIKPTDYDQVITELQTAKRELVAALLEAADDIHDYADPNDIVRPGSEIAKYRAMADKWGCPMSGIIRVLGYQWCALRAGAVVEGGYQLIRTLSGTVLIYCRVEQWSDEHNGGVRKAPIKLSEIDEVTI